MGAKQSKRSVDISGKETEGGGAGEVAAAGAGGEGRLEHLADADALKPQLNGDAHIQQDQQTDKEKELDSGTPENEKDATTEKETKEEEDKDKEVAPVTNGESESKVENGDSTPTPEDGKKPKKEKVKKKWSLRSISFSRKDKPKQEKKQKEEEPKTNGEQEKVPEEAAEATAPEVAANEVAEEAKVAEEVKAPAEEKEEKTPETPVTEPLTNGTSTPDSTKSDTPASEAAVEASPSPTADVTPPLAPEPHPDPDQLPVNGLSLEEPKPEIPEVEKPQETKLAPPAAETVEIVPAPEIPKEVCVERMPLLEPMPPPLPANPPPSSVASFAATTMAPELTDASLPNTADAAIVPRTALPETPAEPTAIETLENDITLVLKETKKGTTEITICEPEILKNKPAATFATEINAVKQVDESPKPDVEVEPKVVSDAIVETQIKETSETDTEILENVISNAVTETPEIINKTAPEETPVINIETTVEVPKIITETAIVKVSENITETASVEASEIITESSEVLETVEPEPTRNEIPEKIELEIITTTVAPPEVELVQIEVPETVAAISETNVLENGTVHSEEVEIEAEIPTHSIAESVVSESLPEPENIPESDVDISEADDSSLPPPPIQDEDDSVVILDEVDEKVEESLKQIPEPIAEPEVAVVESNSVLKAETTTNGKQETRAEAAMSADTDELKKKARAALEASGCAATCLQNGAAPDHHTPQEPLPVSDKITDLIPEVPDMPELKPETLQETVTDVAVAN